MDKFSGGYYIIASTARTLISLCTRIHHAPRPSTGQIESPPHNITREQLFLFDRLSSGKNYQQIVAPNLLNLKCTGRETFRCEHAVTEDCRFFYKNSTAAQEKLHQLHAQLHYARVRYQQVRSDRGAAEIE